MTTYRGDEPGLSAELRDALAHYGILRKSGRYPWGSGENAKETEYGRATDFLGMVDDLKAQGLSDVEVSRGLGFDSTTQMRDTITIANAERKKELRYQAEKLRDKGWSAQAIADHLGMKNESSVRELLKPQALDKARVLENTVTMLREEVDKGGWLDIGAGTEFYVPGSGLSKEKLRAAVAILKDEGYVQIDVQTPTATKNKTTVKTLCPPGTKYGDVVRSMDQIKTLVPHTEDGGRTTLGILPPLAIDPKRVGVMYAEDGGRLADGVVYVRPGVKDVSLGGSNYAQVRIDVGGTHYIKGMAMYKQDMPPGVDLLVATNKKRGTPMMGDKSSTVLKNQTGDKENPFGAVLKRQITEGPETKKRVTSVMNIVREEGDWDDWSRGLSSQVLSKQSHVTAKAQLDITYARKKESFDEIMSLTNPTLRAHLLGKFADEVDSAAVHLNAAGMPRSSYHAILPFNSLKDTEIYAPNFKQGERVALIRYPHGGTFEIPELVVNNNARAPKSAIGRAKDAVGINAKVAERLSGADFDGDFVMVIPNDRNVIKSTPPLKGLEKFDPQKYKLPEDAPRMDARTKGLQMGDVSNLITDMTIKKATSDEIARAVRHSMVVIDAEKHHLDWKRSARDNGIPALKQKYQGAANRGSATLISRATSPAYVDKRRARRAAEGGPIDAATGKKMFTPTGETKRVLVKKNGEWVDTGRVETVKQKSTKLAETDDARSLISDNGGTLIERVYADYSNSMKGLANQARKEMLVNQRTVPASTSAKRVYKSEVDQLRVDLRIAKQNAPRERAAQVLSGKIVAQKKAANPDMGDDQLKKVRQQALAEARTRLGAKKVLVPITDQQWAAIQAGAVSKSMLKDILDNTDIEKLKERATPRPDLKMGSSEKARAQALINRGLTQAEVAQVLGVSLTTLKKGLV